MPTNFQNAQGRPRQSPEVARCICGLLDAKFWTLGQSRPWLQVVLQVQRPYNWLLFLEGGGGGVSRHVSDAEKARIQLEGNNNMAPRVGFRKQASKQASNQTSKRAGRQAGMQAGMQVCRQVSKQTSKRASNQPTTQAGRQATSNGVCGLQCI